MEIVLPEALKETVVAMVLDDGRRKNDDDHDDEQLEHLPLHLADPVVLAREELDLEGQVRLWRDRANLRVSVRVRVRNVQHRLLAHAHGLHSKVPTLDDLHAACNRATRPGRRQTHESSRARARGGSGCSKSCAHQDGT